MGLPRRSRHPAGGRGRGRVPFAVRGRRWLELDGAQQKAYVMHLLDGLEVVNRDKRLKVARAILYLAQGKDRVRMRPRTPCLAPMGGLGEMSARGGDPVAARCSKAPSRMAPGPPRQFPPNHCLPWGLSRRVWRLR